MDDIQKKRMEQHEQLHKLIDAQVQRNVDFVRGEQAWKKILEEVPVDVVARVLGSTLSSGRFQMTPRCQCCCRS